MDVQSLPPQLDGRSNQFSTDTLRLEWMEAFHLFGARFQAIFSRTQTPWPLHLRHSFNEEVVSYHDLRQVAQ